MKFHKNYILASVLLLGLIMTVVGSSAAASDVEVVKVGDVPVTIFELQREQQRILPTNASYHGGLSQEKLAKIREQALSGLIDRAYKVNAALAAGMKADAKQLEEKLESYRKKYPSKKEYKKALGDEGEKLFRASLERELLAVAAEQKLVADRVQVSDQEVQAFYEQNKATYMRPKQFKASHILIQVDPSSNKEERMVLEKKALDLAARAKAGEDFYDLAYYNSDDRSKYVGGDLGYFHEGQTIEEFEDAVMNMKAGEISAPIKSMYGYHIIKLVEINPQRQLLFDEVSSKIRQTLEGRVREKLYADWLTSLKAKYPVQRF